jgi:hypothetical protein
MKRLGKVLTVLLAVSLVMSAGAAEAQASGVVKKNTLTAAAKGYSLAFDTASYSSVTFTVNGTDIPVRAYENIVYVRYPVDTTYETMNVYIPEAYFQGGSVNGYTAETAPVFFRNTVAAYMPGKALSLTETDSGAGDMPAMGGGMPAGGDLGGMPAGGAMASADGTPLPSMGGGGTSDSDNMKQVLMQGYVLACPGARGRTTTSSDGKTYTGKAPAGLVDLKAAVRYLRYNDSVMPGSAEKIITDGTSAGGAMSALLGATGNNSAYAPYLEELGAASGRDDVFASLDYCPIINLENADTAYEWQYAGLSSSSGFGGAKTFSGEKLERSAELSSMFPAYVNSLNLKAPDGSALTLDDNGNGSFKEYIKSYVICSAQQALDAGTDLSAADYLTIEDGKVTDVDFAAFNAATGRQKSVDAFDALDLSAGENSEFGTASVDKQHFTQYGLSHSTVSGSTIADQNLIRIMNPMSFIGQSGNTVAPNFRIRYGTADSNTSEAIEMLFAAKLQNNGANVDIAFPWGVGHSGDYDFDTLFPWIDGLCR